MKVNNVFEAIVLIVLGVVGLLSAIMAGSYAFCVFFKLLSYAGQALVGAIDGASLLKVLLQFVGSTAFVVAIVKIGVDVYE